MTYRIIHGDVIELLREVPDEHFHGILCDPPYGYRIMGKEWDHGVPSASVWAKVLRVCRPGAHLLAFGGTRTHHRLMCAIEDAGWEIRDCLFWAYGSGFPKSRDVSKAIDAEAGANKVRTATEPAIQWAGFGTALKPAVEPIVLARKAIDGTVAHNAVTHGCGGLNVDGCRVGPGHEKGSGRDGQGSADRRYTENGGTNFAAKPGTRGGGPNSA